MVDHGWYQMRMMGIEAYVNALVPNLFETVALDRSDEEGRTTPMLVLEEIQLLPIGGTKLAFLRCTAWCSVGIGHVHGHCADGHQLVAHIAVQLLEMVGADGRRVAARPTETR